VQQLDFKAFRDLELLGGRDAQPSRCGRKMKLAQSEDANDGSQTKDR
jgi:hypothetical protein